MDPTSDGCHSAFLVGTVANGYPARTRYKEIAADDY